MSCTAMCAQKLMCECQLLLERQLYKSVMMSSHFVCDTCSCRLVLFATLDDALVVLLDVRLCRFGLFVTTNAVLVVLLDVKQDQHLI